jgi:hypothetical protein
VQIGIVVLGDSLSVVPQYGVVVLDITVVLLVETFVVCVDFSVDDGTVVQLCSVDVEAESIVLHINAVELLILVGVVIGTLSTTI